MNWTLQDRGFLPNSDPLVQIKQREFSYLEQLSRDLPHLVDEGQLQEYIGTHPIFPDTSGFTEFLDCGNEMAMERAFMIFSYLASAFIHAKDYRGKVQHSIPYYIAKPLVRLGKAIGRPPILSYASYCLNNWRRLDQNGPIELGNIALLQNFTKKAKQDEDWFILVHVDIEAKAHAGLEAMKSCWDFGVTSPGHFKGALEKLHGSLVAMNQTLARMPECCSPEVYYSQVRPYIFGFTNIVYEGCFDNKPQSFRGETGAQSSIIPAILAFLTIKHKDSMLTKHLDDMQNYMPPEHVRFIDSCRGSFRDHIIWHHSPVLNQLYNACVEEVIVFRKQHFDYAVNYIEKRVDDPTGTGGTPYIKWLSQLIEETKQFFIHE